MRNVAENAAQLPAVLDPAAYTFGIAQLPHFVGALAILGAAAAVWHAERGSRISRYFVLFSVLFAMWVAGRGLIHMADRGDVAVQLARNLFAVSSIALPLLLRIIAMILMRERQQNAFIVLNWFFAITLSLVAINTPWFVAYTEVFSWGMEPIFGPAGYLYIGWVMALIGYVSLELYRAHRTALPGSIERRRLRRFSMAVFMLYFGVFEFFSAMGLPVYPVGGLGVVGFTLMVAHLTQRYGLVEITAQLATDQIIELVRGGLLIVDQDGLIRLFSRRAGHLLGLDRRQVTGKPAHLYLGDSLRVPTLATLARHEEGSSVEAEFSYLRPHSHSAMTLGLSVSAVHDRKGREVAYTCLLRDLSEQKRLQQERERERLTDPLTGLPNRAMFMALLDAAAERCRKDPTYRYGVCVVGVERDRATLNEDGYTTTDNIVSALAERIRGASRPQDAVARVGDEEFAVLIRGMGSAQEIAGYVQHLRDELRAPVDVDSAEYSLSTYIGSSSNASGVCDGADLLRSANSAMFRARESPVQAQK
jgi:diguanylate cyclase (GGDEF)-like protein/PAS domain S-box-containing protein